jgi:hypothetical protein
MVTYNESERCAHLIGAVFTAVMFIYSVLYNVCCVDDASYCIVYISREREELLRVVVRLL